MVLELYKKICFNTLSAVSLYYARENLGQSRTWRRSVSSTRPWKFLPFLVIRRARGNFFPRIVWPKYSAQERNRTIISFFKKKVIGALLFIKIRTIILTVQFSFPTDFYPILLFQPSNLSGK
jgi:hypothetical protein